VREHAYWVPEALSLVVAKAIRRKPDERYQMAEDMQVDLLGVEDSVLARASASVPDHLQVEQSETAGGVSQLESQFESFERRTSRGKVIGVVAGSAVAAAVLAAFLILGPLGGSPQADGGGGVDGANVAVADPGAVRAPPADASASPPVKIDDAAAAESAGSPPGAEASAAVGADEGAAVVAPRDVASLSSSVLIVVVGVPARAKVTVGNIEATGDPPQVRVPRSDADLRLVVEARGYQKHVQAVVPSEDRVITVRMRRLPSVPPVSRPDAGRETGGTAFPDFPEDS
jgi:hypothetical protein